MDQIQLKNFLRSRGLKPNFTYGQNFLIDDIVLQDIVDAAEVTKDDRVLEIGPGIGTLTELLCERAGFVLAVEKDPQFLPVLKSLKKKFPDNFMYEIGDALELDFQSAFAGRGLQYSPPGTGGVPDEVGGGGRALVHTTPSRQVGTPLLSEEGNETTPRYKVVANIPYYITGKIIQMLMTAKHKPESVVILTQKEVAENIVAAPGKLSLLAISVQVFGKPEIIQKIPARSFYPMPKVDSAVLKIVPYSQNPYGILNEKKFFALLRACFSGKRKQIHNTLKNNMHLSEHAVAEILSSAGINSAARPQELSIEQWIELNDKIERFKD